MTDYQIRASDHDREDAALVLAEAYAAGRLTHSELAQRAAAVYSARTWGRLCALTADLPAGPPYPAFRRPSSRRGLVAASQAHAARLRLVTTMACILTLVLVAGLAGLLIPAALWAAAVLIPAALLLPPAIGISAALRHLHGNTAAPSRDQGRQHPPPGGCPRRCQRTPGLPRGAAPGRGCHARRAGHTGRPQARRTARGRRLGDGRADRTFRSG
jgi:hypothetical protein